MAKLEAARAEGCFVVVCTTPDVCKTPPNAAPVPYQIVGVLTDAMRESPDVNVRGKPAMTLNSRVTKVTGNEAGAMGGVKSGVNLGFCKPITFSTTVRVDGYNILYQTQTKMEMNCPAPDAGGNTIGKLIYSGPQTSAAIGPDGPAPADPLIEAEIPAEAGFVERMTSVDGIASLAQMAPELATMDWSNPMSALGTVQGLAGIGGLGQAARVAGLARQGMAIAEDPEAALGLLGPLGDMAGLPASQIVGLATTDWSNPGAVLGAASNLAGLGACAGALGNISGCFGPSTSGPGTGRATAPGASRAGWMQEVQDGIGFLKQNSPALSVLADSLWGFVDPHSDTRACGASIDAFGALGGNADPDLAPETLLEQSVGLLNNLYRPEPASASTRPQPNLEAAVAASALEPEPESEAEARFLRRWRADNPERAGSR